MFSRELCRGVAGARPWCHSEGRSSSRRTSMRSTGGNETPAEWSNEYSLTLTLYCAFKLSHLSLVACLVESVLTCCSILLCCMLDCLYLFH
jgi:hypothetical protein